MNNLSKKILGKIKKENIKPIPKWHFLLKRSFTWSMFIVSIILGSIAFSIILFHIQTADWDVHIKIKKNLFSFIFLLLPYFWILLMGGFTALAYYNFKHTKGSYKYGVFLKLGISLIISLIIGGIINTIGVSEKLEDSFQRNPYYQRTNKMRERIWMNEENGLIAGEIIQVNDNNIIILRSLDNKKWIVDTNETNFKEYTDLKEELRIKIIGEKIDNTHFKAEEIRPWRPKKRIGDFLFRHGVIEKNPYSQKFNQHPRRDIMLER